MAAQTIAISAHYRVVDLQQLTGVGGTAVALPTPTASLVTPKLNARPDNIFVQAPVGNTQNITIGKTGVASGGAGIELAPGANTNLPSNDYTYWQVIAAGAGQKLNVVYGYGPQ